jgi:hypothetical protein
MRPECGIGEESPGLVPPDTEPEGSLELKANATRDACRRDVASICAPLDAHKAQSLGRGGESELYDGLSGLGTRPIWSQNALTSKAAEHASKHAWCSPLDRSSRRSHATRPERDHRLSHSPNQH